MYTRYCNYIVLTIALGMFPPVAAAEPGPIGKQLADHSRGDTSQNGKDCYNALYNRLKHVLSKNRRHLPEIHGDRNRTNSFKMLWVTNFDFPEWKDIDGTYKACGPAGALASKGLADLVTHKEIWEGKLEPGAVVQIWDVWKGPTPSGDKSKGTDVFRALHSGKDYTNKLGHSFIFLEYTKDPAGRIKGMLIADQGTGWNQVTEKTFGLWVGANLKD